MAGVRIDPEKTLEFVGHMQAYRENVIEETNALKSRFDYLKESWDDQQRDKFEETFTELMAALQRFHDNMEEQEPFLQRLAQLAQEILDTQLR